MERRCGRCGAALKPFDVTCPTCSAPDSGAGIAVDTSPSVEPIGLDASSASPIPGVPSDVLTPGPGVDPDKATAVSPAAPRPPKTGGFRPVSTRMPRPAPELEQDPLVKAIPPDETGLRRLGGVVLIRRLGMGGMGAVYAGHHGALDIPVAVKIMHPHLAGDEAYADRFVREAQVSARIDHHNLVRTLHAGAEHGVFFLIMEFVEGMTAGQVLKSEGPLSEVRAIRIVLDATRALAEAHRRGIVHRDVKPDNILVRKEDGRGKLADLGLARALEHTPASITGTGTTLGTPNYMAPEQIEDASHVGPEADVYSMGATLYELVCGAPPFTASSISALFQQILSRDPLAPEILRPQITAAVREAIVRSLEKAPGKRYASAAELEQALERALAVASSDRPPGAPVGQGLAKAETSPILPKPVQPDTDTGIKPAPPSDRAPARPASDRASPPPSPPLPPEGGLVPSLASVAAAPVPVEPPRRRDRLALIRTIATLVVAVVAIAAFVPSLPMFQGRTFYLGLLPDRRVTTDRLKSMEPLRRFVEHALGKKVEFFIGGSYGENVEAFAEGRIQLAQFGGATYVLARDRVPEAVPIFQRDVDRRFRALFVTPSSSPAAKLEDLKGKRIAYVDPLSTSGFVLPACLLLDAGIDPKADFSTVLFSHGHDATLEAIRDGQIDVGVVDERVYYLLLEQGRLDGAQLKVLARSPEFPDDVWCVGPSVEPKARAALTKAFLSLDPAKEQDRLVLLCLEAKRYVAAHDDDYAQLRVKVRRLQAKGLFPGGN